MSNSKKNRFLSFSLMPFGSSRGLTKRINMKQGEDCMGRGKGLFFRGSNVNFLHSGRLVLEESISLFHGKTNPIRCFSIDELNTMVLDCDSHVFCDAFSKWYKGIWEGRPVIVRLHDRITAYGCGIECIIREIVVATQMGSHNSVQKLLGCCLETDFPVMVYEWVGTETLADRILGYGNQHRQPLEWKARLRIAWEISHAIAYLHTAFRRPIIHKDLKPAIVFLDQDNAAKLSDFSLSVSIPEGEEYVQSDKLIGCFSYLAPEYRIEGRVAGSADVYSFGVLFLVLLTGKAAVFSPTAEGDDKMLLVNWVTECLKGKCVSEIVDPLIFANKVMISELLQQQLRASIQLALQCTEEEADSRPTMVDVATELHNLLRSS
ncbi:hypothetical protein BVRB_2g044980 [Beta vulgaris subsp. vulgaris]|uniref:Protein kinase domain-containing protein n=1 Tax=Beta vulgaris subsp. vulgaris TaxID=3555 RepID=A0A0J8BH91_BETVV|nr:hypothetical protein BVRB_2g044980 [Beta vulgaris subsp. vulgaris]